MTGVTTGSDGRHDGVADSPPFREVDGLEQIEPSPGCQFPAKGGCYLLRPGLPQVEMH
jgi:hypothetical protein